MRRFRCVWSGFGFFDPQRVGNAGIDVIGERRHRRLHLFVGVDDEPKLGLAVRTRRMEMPCPDTFEFQHESAVWTLDRHERTPWTAPLPRANVSPIALQITLNHHPIERKPLSRDGRRVVIFQEGSRLLLSRPGVLVF